MELLAEYLQLLDPQVASRLLNSLAGHSRELQHGHGDDAQDHHG
jgi:hypothetical protein